MRAVIQRVQQASVTVDDRVIGEIGYGLMVLLAIAKDDDEAIADKLLHKLLNLRIFNDEQGKMNLGLKTAGFELLVVSQFTLLADTSKGLRPSFNASAEPVLAKQLYEYFLCSASRCELAKVASGEFGADMAVSLINDGPVTLVIDV